MYGKVLIFYWCSRFDIIMYVLSCEKYWKVPGIFIKCYTGWRKKKLTCLIRFNLKAKRATTRELRALHSVLSNLDFDI
jgi:hypothetical protein